MEHKFCNCINEMESKILEFFQDKDLINPNKAEFENKAFLMSDDTGPGVQPYLPVRIHSETKNGKPKKTKVNVYFSYCPMCGQNWRPKKDGE